MTERGHYHFTVKEGARGHFWVAAEPAGSTIRSLDDCVLGFELEPKALTRPRDSRCRFPESEHRGDHVDLTGYLELD